MAVFSINDIVEIENAYKAANKIVAKYGGAYLPILVRIDKEKRNADEFKRIFLSAVAQQP